MQSLTLHPIGVMRTLHATKVDAPRQPAAAKGVPGVIHLRADLNLAHAIQDLAGWERIWVIFWFDRNAGWRPKVLPPRSTRGRKGVLATRAPHRPNPIGLSALRLVRIEGLALHVLDVDLLDGTPILDIKPYVPYTDAFPESASGWLAGDAADPRPPWRVEFTPESEAQLAWLASRLALPLRERIVATLSLGPQPHPYRRIRRGTDVMIGDITWTGGVSELKKMATMAEAYAIPLAPHDHSGPVNLWASAHVLLNVPNGIENEPQVSSERAPNQWADDQTWPPPGTVGTVLRPSSSGLGTAAGTGTAAFTDNGSGTPSNWLSGSNTGRAIYSTAPLASDLRVAGTSSITVGVSSSTPTAHLTAYLVDYGPAVVRTGEGIRTLTTESCWGESRTGDDACYRNTEATTGNVDAQIIARGWADLANYASLSAPRTITPGTKYRMTFRLSTTDWVVPAGHRLGLLIGGTDSSATLRPSQLPRLTVDLADTSVRIPLRGAVPSASAVPLIANSVSAGTKSELG